MEVVHGRGQKGRGPFWLPAKEKLNRNQAPQGPACSQVGGMGILRLGRIALPGAKMSGRKRSWPEERANALLPAAGAQARGRQVKPPVTSLPR